jgi:aarF domain-containing kinase
VYLDYTTKKVMVLERLHGVSLLDDTTVQRITQSHAATGTNTILTALNIWSMSVTSMPWFHADVHAGNLLLLHDGRVGFIDFGIVGRISPKVLNSVSELSTALALNDSQGMARALCNMGATDAAVDIVRFGNDLDRILQRMSRVQPDVTVVAMADGSVRGLMDVNEAEVTDLMLELVQVTENNGLKLPREFGLLVKQALYFDRYLKVLAPNVDVLTDTRVMIGGKPRTVATTTTTTATTTAGTTEVVVVDVDSSSI